MDIPIVSITGTKGKTTTTFVVSEALHAMKHNVLRVDTTGHYVNGKQRSTLEDSKKTWGLVPTVAPGRYLWEFFTEPKLQKHGVAVLEAALGSSSLSGTAYRAHKIGVFLNVFEDHLGSSSRLKSKSDIAIAKEFVFSRLDRDGWAVFNADDPLVVRSLRALPTGLNVKLIPCGLSLEHFNLESHLAAGGIAVTIEGSQVVLLSGKNKQVLFDLTNIPWTFGGTFAPSSWNLMLAAGAVLALYDGEWKTGLREAFEAVRLDPYGGRLTVLKSANGTTILADYAHEKISLVEVAKLGRTLVGKDGKLIGVLRLATDRTDELIHETGHAVATAYDKCIVFDKIDGYYRKPRRLRSSRFPEVVGRVSELYANAIQEKNPDVERILREDYAIKRATELAGSNDVVVVIVNDDVRQSLGFVRKYFRADFV